MPPKGKKQPITVVSACKRADGCPDFAMTQVEATAEEIENGIHFYVAEAELLEAGYEEPFLHFDESDSPSFLFPAVTEYLRAGRADANPPASR